MAEAQVRTPSHASENVVGDKWPKWVLEANSGKKRYLRSFKPITVSSAEPACDAEGTPTPGAVRVLKIYGRFQHVESRLKTWPDVVSPITGIPYTRINVCKNFSAHGTQLSPMALGPVTVDGKVYALTLEDGWQCSKFYGACLCGADVDDEDAWLPAWTAWSRRGRFSREARRHRRPKRNTGLDLRGTNVRVPLFSYFRGKRLGYKAAREAMYLPWYAELATQTPAFHDLVARHRAGENFLFLDFDGLDRDSPEDNVDLHVPHLTQLLADGSRPFGHGLALAALLLAEGGETGARVWESRVKAK